MQKISECQGMQIGRWTVVKLLGCGGSGTVYEVEDSSQQPPIRAALKVLNKKMLMDAIRTEVTISGCPMDDLDAYVDARYNKYIASFKKEYEHLIATEHENIAKAYEFGWHDGHYYFCQELIQGAPFVDSMKKKDPLDMIPYFIQVLEGLDFIHRNRLLHLDIKSENVLLCDDGGQEKVKIIDFGISTIPSDYNGNFCGSGSYISPEIALGWKDQVDARADLFSVAVLFYYCLTWGRPPFYRKKSEKDFRKIRAIIEKERLPRAPSYAHSNKVPAYLDIIILRLLEKYPDKRFYNNARSVINAILTHQPDAFIGTKSNYFVAAQHVVVGHEDVLQDIATSIQDRSALSKSYIIKGNSGTGKTHLLNYIAHKAMMHLELWATIRLSFPMDETHISESIEKIMTTIISNTHGIIILIDNFHELSTCSPFAQAQVIECLKQCVSIINRKQQQVGILAKLPSLLLFVTYVDTNDPLSVSMFLEGHHDTIELSNFSQKLIKSYLGKMPAFTGNSVSDALVEKIYRMTKGNPAEIVDVVSGLNVGSSLFALDGSLIDLDHMDIQTVPTSTSQRWQLTYTSISEDERNILDFLSVWQCKQLSCTVTFSDLSYFIDHSMLGLMLMGLQEQDILRFDNQTGRYSFSDEHLSTHIYANLSSEKRCQWHDRLAGYIPLRGQLQLLHIGYGSDVWQGVKNLIKLGRQLFDAGNPLLAKDLFSDAFSRIGEKKHKLRLYISSLLIDAFHVCGEYRAAIDLFNSLNDICTSCCNSFPMILVRLYMSIIPVYTNEKKYIDAERLWKKAIYLLKNNKKNALYMCLLNLKARIAYNKSFDGEKLASKYLNIAKKGYMRSISLEERLPSINRLRVTNNDLGLVFSAMGSFESARDYLLQKLSRIEVNPNCLSLIATLLALADAYRLTQKYDDAMHCAKRALTLSCESKIGAKWRIQSHRELAAIYYAMDDYIMALTHSQYVMAGYVYLNNNANHEIQMARLWVQMGHCYKELQQWDQAILYFSSAIEYSIGQQSFVSAYEGLGESYYYQNDFKNALQYLGKSEELLIGLSINIARPYRFRIKKIRIDIAMACKQTDNVEVFVDELARLAIGFSELEDEVDDLKARLSTQTKWRV